MQVRIVADVIASEHRERSNTVHQRGMRMSWIASSRVVLLAMTHSISLFLILFFATLPATAQEPLQKADDPKDYVSEVLPYPLEEVYERAARLFDSDRRDFYEDYNAAIYDLPEPVKTYKDLSPAAYKKFLALPIVRHNKFYVFFGAYPSMQNMIQHLTPLAAMGHSNAALQRYAKLPMNARENDFYVWSPDTPYWHSEYRLGDKPLPFRSYFIVHLSRIDDAHTEVEVIENEPVVRLGGTASVDIHGTVRHYELREVEPTTSDREFLLSCVRQFIERKVPGRHWFRCRDKGEKVEEPVPFTLP
jgi:hypothetical protein